MPLTRVSDTPAPYAGRGRSVPSPQQACANNPCAYFRMKTSLLILLALILFPATRAACEAPLVISPDLVGRLLDEAQRQRPAIAAGDARVEASSEAVNSVRTWEDPRVSIGIWAPGSNSFSSAQMGNILYGIEQKLPVFGRPDLMRSAAEADAAVERSDLRLQKIQLRHDLRSALVDLALADQNLRLASESLSWAQAQSAEVDTRYRSGKSREVDWLRAESERVKAEEAVVTAGKMREHQELEMNRLLNRDLHASWPEVALPEPADGSVDFDDRLVDAALAFAPSLERARREQDRQSASVRITRSQRLPDIGLGLAARQYASDGTLREGSLTVDFTLPWLNRKGYDADLRRDQARVKVARAQTEEESLLVREQLHGAVVNLDTARRQAALYRDKLLPLAQQTLSSARIAWENDLGVLQDALDAHRMEVEYRQSLAAAQADHARILADIALLTGLDDPAQLYSSHSR